MQIILTDTLVSLSVFKSFESRVPLKLVLEGVAGVALLITGHEQTHNNLRVRLSPLKSHILRKYTNPFKRCGMYPSISKCNAKRCKCCKHLSTKTTVTSSDNGRQFSVINNLELD